MQHTSIYRTFCAVLALVLCVSLCGCEPEAPPDNSQPVQTQPTETVQTPTQPPATTQPTVQTAPVRTWDAHSGIRADGSFNDGTLFIGDSLTYGLITEYLQPYDDMLGDARYMATVGAPLPCFFLESYRLGSRESSLYSKEFKGKTYAEGAQAAGDALTAVYIMLGTNYGGVSVEAYVKVVDFLLENCPRATIYLQTIPYSWSDSVYEEEVNGYIWGAYEHYQQQGNERVFLIDTYTAIDMFVKHDGVHLSPDGYDAWYNAILSFAYNHDIPE